MIMERESSRMLVRTKAWGCAGGKIIWLDGWLIQHLHSSNFPMIIRSLNEHANQKMWRFGWEFQESFSCTLTMNSDGVNSYQYDHALWGMFKKKKNCLLERRWTGWYLLIKK